MPSLVSLYHSEMHDNLGFFATWLPGDRVEIGDAGVFENGRFRKMSSLSELDISWKESETGAAQNVQYTATEGAKLGMSAGVAAAGIAQAKIKIDFSREGAFMFHATGLQEHRLEDRSRVGNGVTDAFLKGRWKEEWLLIDAVHVADCATIIVSQDNSAGLVLAAEAQGAIVPVSLADPKVKLSVVSTRGRLIHVIAGQHLRPLYSCLRVKTSFWGDLSIAPVRGQRRPSFEQSSFERPSIDELLQS
jgi:hypothetical protein